jgi:hypothetical protein
MLRHRKTLGIALEDAAALVAEVSVSSGGSRLLRAAEYRFPEGASLRDASSVGRGLREWLKENGFASKKAAFGIPAKWLLAREQTVPPVDSATAAAILRTQTERRCSLDIGDLAMDYTGEVSARAASNVLVVATTRERLAQVDELARAAGLDVLAVSSSSLTLACALAQPAEQSCLLYVRESYGELVVRSGGRLRLLRHLFWGSKQGGGADSGVAALAALAAELRRAASLLGLAGVSGAGQVFLWNASSMPMDAGVAAEAGSLGRNVVACGLSNLGLASALRVEHGAASRFGAAAALALTASRGRLLPVDFLHSRLSVRTKRRFARRILLPVTLCLVALAAFIVLFLDWRRAERDLADMNARLTAMEPEIKEADNFIKTVSYARAWYGTTPRFLDCLRKLAQVFPEEGTIWASSIALRAEGQGVLSGKAMDQKVVLDVVDRMSAGGGFSDVKLLFIREAGTSSRELSFAVSFAFAGAD